MIAVGSGEKFGGQFVTLRCQGALSRDAAARSVDKTRGVEITCVTIDCREPATIATFWKVALGWRDLTVAPDGSSAVCSPPSAGVYLEFIRVPEEKAVKNRVHLGCHAGSVKDLDSELDRLRAIGATVAWEEKFLPSVAAQYRNVVLRDPEGNEFCLGGGTPSA